MKKLFLSIVVLAIVYTANAQDKIQQALAVFPYQQIQKAQSSIESMYKLESADWKKIFSMLEDDSLKLSPTYALAAFVHDATSTPSKKSIASNVLLAGLTNAKSFYVKNFIIQHLGVLGDDASVKKLSKLLKDKTYIGQAAARALATIHSSASIAALESALLKATGNEKMHLQAALDNARFVLPNPVSSVVKNTVVSNPVQHLLKLQDRMAAAKDPIEKSRILNEAEFIPGFTSLMFVGNYLEDDRLKKQAALIVARLTLADASLRGRAVRAVAEKALPLIAGTDSAVLVKNLITRLKAIPYDYGFESMFNGKDLTGWKGLVSNPIARSKMTAEDLLKAEAEANAKAKQDWVIDNGLLVFTGHGDNLCTVKKYGDFEMYVDWKITEKGDAGIYLRGSPQVQIWDTSRREVGAQVGSGGLYNNKINESKPSTVADNPINQWNNFHIIMKGDRVTVFLNGIKVTDNVVLENYWDRNLPIFVKEQIELQAHGTYVAYRNLFIRELPSDDLTVQLSDEEKKQGFEVLFDGSNMDKWVGSKTSYMLKDGVIEVNPTGGSGGNLYTAEEYADFEFRFEFQLTPGANNGLGIRAPLTGDAAYVGMELQILDNDAPVYAKLNPYQYHGSVYGVIPSKRGYLKPTGEWNEQTVVVKGNDVKVTLNGQVILDGNIKDASINGTADHRDHPGLKNPTGHIGFLGHGDVVRFRNIRIKKLDIQKKK
ncbi:MAG: DUF1080 domain-containing protein [Chitinophagia bacterium]|nr:DUF1080 domain-containing protein [Chitinophagia bacterium]